MCEGFSYITSREGFVSKVDRYVTNTVQLVRKKKRVEVEMKRVNPIPYYSNIGIEKEQKRQEIEIKK